MEKSLSECLEEIRSLDHKLVMKSLDFNESSEHNLELLITATKYCREKVFPLYENFTRLIMARSILLAKKNAYFLESLTCLKDMRSVVLEKSDNIKNKCKTVSAKQSELLNRANTLIYKVQESNIGMSEAENKFCAETENYIEQISYFQKSIEEIHKRHNAIKIQTDHFNASCNYLYLHEWQLKIIKDSLSCIGEEISKLIGDIPVIKDELEKYELVLIEND